MVDPLWLHGTPKNNQLEPKSHPAPNAAWRTGSVERRLARREYPSHRRKRTRDEVAFRGKSGGTELSAGVVLAVKQVVDLAE